MSKDRVEAMVGVLDILDIYPLSGHQNGRVLLGFLDILDFLREISRHSGQTS